MKLKDVFDFMGFEESAQINAFMNMFQLINCRYCPAKEECSKRHFCEYTLIVWLESEVQENGLEN